MLMRAWCVVGLGLVCVPWAVAQSSGNLAAEIAQIRAIDDHAHVPINATDRAYDELPCDAPSTAAPPFMQRPGNPDLVRAWVEHYGLSGTPTEAQAVEAKKRAMAQHANDWHAWVLDQAATEMVFANHVTPIAQLDKARFRWVPYDDALLFPLDNRNERAVSSDRDVFYGHEEALLREYMKSAGVAALPATLADYVNRVLKPTLAAQKQAGAVAIKFEVAYLRSLNFEPATEAEAARVYQQYRASGPPRAEYKKLQDYLFRAIAAEAGRLKLPLQIHTGEGCGDFFQAAGADPLLLESVVSDAALQQTQFVVLHGGWPFTEHTAAMLLKPNVWGEFSAQTLLNSNHTVAETLRLWLEKAPQKVLYGSDAFPVSEGFGWEESMWMANRNARASLATALEGMLADGEVSREEALGIARGVLRENAAKLYGVK